MNPRQFALFLGFYFYVLNVNAANDAQRVILLSSLIQIRALQAQLLLWNQRRRRRRGRRFPCFWVLPRPQQSLFDIHYFDATIPGDYFRRQLRLNRNTFSVLLNILRPRLTRQNTHLRDCVTPEKLLALGLYRLAHGNSYITIGPNFNVGKSTVIEAVQDVVEALRDLRNEYIKFPSTNREVLATRETFDDLTDLPNVVGAIDGTHVKIKTPKESEPDYFSRLQQHDVVVQAVANEEKRFLDVAAGFPGSIHDSRGSVECAFGILKGRWRILQKRLDSDIAFTNQIIIACCVLHNFCIEAGDLWDDDDDEDGNDDDFPVRDGNADGADLRDFLKNYLRNL